MQEIRMFPYNHIVPPTTSLEKLHTNKLKSGNVSSPTKKNCLLFVINPSLLTNPRKL